MDKFIKFLNTIEQHKQYIFVIVCDDADKRQLIHKFIETKYPKVSKTSLTLDVIPTHDRDYWRCGDCNKLFSIKYYTGIASNNQDEYHTGYCNNNQCESYNCSFSYEPNYDDSDGQFITVTAHNSVIVTKYGNYTPGKSCKPGTVQKKDLEPWFNELDNYIIKVPSNSLNKVRLQDYLTAKIKINKI